MIWKEGINMEVPLPPVMVSSSVSSRQKGDQTDDLFSRQSIVASDRIAHRVLETISQEKEGGLYTREYIYFANDVTAVPRLVDSLISCD